MRPPVPKEARRSHLQPCPRCGEENGITAIACWKCDLQLIPDALLAPRQATQRSAPAAQEVPRIDSEVPAEVLERIQGLRLGHDGPHTLPPLGSRTDAHTANDPHFGAAWASPQFRLLWAAAGVALAASLLAWLVPRAPAERPALRAATATVVAPAVAPSPGRPVAIAQPSAAGEKPAVAAMPPARAAAERPASVAAAAPLPVAAAQAQITALPAARPQPRARTGERPAQRLAAPPAAARAAAQREQEAVRRIGAESARRPAPVQAPCTPQVAALGFCDSK